MNYFNSLSESIRRAILTLVVFAGFMAPSMTANASDRNPVLLVHGIFNNGRTMERMARYLRSQGWDARTITLTPSWGQKGLDILAGQVADFVESHYAKEQKIDLVGFSMGGLICRYYLQRMGGLDHVERFVCLSGPNHGSVLAWLLPNAGCRQMRPGSAFLRDLNSDADSLKKIEFTTFWTPFDLTIVPARSTVMPQARNIRTYVLLHPLMVWEKSSAIAVAGALRAADSPLNSEMPAAR